MSDSQQPQTPISRLEQLERQIASKFESLLQGVREELGEGVRLAGEEIQEFVQSARRRAEEATEEAEEARRKAKRAAEEAKEARQPETPERPAPDAGDTLGRLVDGLARIDGEFGQADVIQALLAESRGFASRAAFFLIRQGQLRAWSSVGFGAGGGRLEGLQASTDDEPWSSLGETGKSRALDSDLCGRMAKILGVEAPTQGVWIPFVLRGQLAGALYADRVEGDGALGVSGLQILTLGAARSLETAAANPEVSPTLELEGELPALPVDERTVAVAEEEAEEEAEAKEDAVPEAPDLDEIEAVSPETEVPEIETPEVAVPAVEVPKVEMPTAESAAAPPKPPEEVAEEEILEEPEEAELGLEEEEEPTDVVAEAASDDDAAAAAPSVPDVETLEEAPAFEMVEEEPEEEAEEEEQLAEAQVLEEQAAAAVPEVPEVELGAPEPAPSAEAEAEAPEVPEVEVGEPGEVSADEIEFEAEPEAPLDEDTDIWEVEEEEEPTAVGEEEEAAEEGAMEVATPEVSAEDIGPEDVEPPAAPASPEAVSPPRETPSQAGAQPGGAEPGGAQPGYPTSFAEEPPPVSSPPPATTFAGEEDVATEEPTPPSQVTPPPDVQPAAEGTPPAAEARPSTQVTPPEPEPSAEVSPPQPEAPSPAAPSPEAPSPAAPSPEAPSPEETPASQVTPPPDAEPRSESAGSTEVKPPSDLDGPGLAFASPPPGQQAAEVDDAEEALHEEARRLARLLVSEIKLYNEEVIEEGRRAGNIYERLKDDIDRSRQMYEERIDPRLADKEDYFYQELVQRLAGGDEALLGL